MCTSAITLFRITCRNNYQMSHVTSCSFYRCTQTLNYSGCDHIVAVVVFYKLQSNNTWQHRKADRVSDTRLTLHSVNYDVYEVKVSATNNEDITSTSETFVANLLTSMSILFVLYMCHFTTMRNFLSPAFLRVAFCVLRKYSNVPTYSPVRTSSLRNIQMAFSSTLYFKTWPHANCDIFILYYVLLLSVKCSCFWLKTFEFFLQLFMS